MVERVWGRIKGKKKKKKKREEKERKERTRGEGGLLSLTGTNIAVLGRVNVENGRAGRRQGRMMMLAFDVELCECGSGNMNDGNDREGRRRGQIHERAS